MSDNTVFLRLEGPLQAWGICSRFSIRETSPEPTKSGVMGLICCAMGLGRQNAETTGMLERLNKLKMGVRVDRPGWRWKDYHTVGAGYGVLCARGDIKRTEATGEYEAVESSREYLCDASFLVALRGDENTIFEVAESLADPIWTVYLGRKSCPPAKPILARPREGETWTNPAMHDDLAAALRSVDWEPRLSQDILPRDGLRAVLEVDQECGESLPENAEPRQDVAVRFRPPVHRTRYVLVRTMIPSSAGRPHVTPCPLPYRGWPNYRSHIWKKQKRPERLDRDRYCCVFCKMPAKPVHHVDYANAPDHEDVENDLRSLCRLCHDAVTMIEYGLGITQRRIDPIDPRWRTAIVEKRNQILRDRVPLHLERKRALPEEEE